MMTKVQGEYWISNRQAIGVDGDIGDLNHEAIVVQYVFSELIEDMQSCDRLTVIANAIARHNQNDGVDTVWARCEILDYANSINDEELYQDIPKLIGWGQDKFDIAMGLCDDARVYGVNTLKWIRVQNNNIQLHGLTKTRLLELADGLWECFGDDWEQCEYDIEDTANGKFYRGVPGNVIGDVDMGELRTYCN